MKPPFPIIMRCFNDGDMFLGMIYLITDIKRDKKGLENPPKSAKIQGICGILRKPDRQTAEL